MRPTIPMRATRRACLAAGALALAGAVRPARARAAPPAEVQAELPGARLHGEARMRVLGMSIYDIRLWSPADALAEPLQSMLALELEYARTLNGQAIAERSLEEMRRIGPVAPEQGERWLQAMRALFPDVQRGDRLTGVQRPARGARFFHNGRFLGEVAEAEFARLFFGIWLSPRTSEPSLRERLLGPRT